MSESNNRACISRRGFLVSGGAVVTLAALFGSRNVMAADTEVMLNEYPKVKVATLSDLESGKPINISYPYENSLCTLVKLNEEAGGGVGEGNNIVCFSNICPHMGGPLAGTFKPEHSVLGACPMHLTTFDLTHHGMVISGHATQSLPQIVLEVEGEDVYATAVLGLIYGYSSNLGNIR